MLSRLRSSSTLLGTDRTSVARQAPSARRDSLPADTE